MTDEKNDGSQMDGFALGRPALVCRWRLAGRALPLENRHLRALGRRLVAGGPVSKQLVAWAKQHIEWTLADGAARHPDGVLMLVLDEAGRAAMTVGPYEPLAVTTSSALAERAQLAAREAAETGVAPETLWVVRGDVLVAGCPIDQPLSGAASLVADLAKTTGVPVSREADLARRRAGFPPRVNKTERTEADWLRCLESVRKVGYAVSHGESFDGASSVAVPVISRRVAIASVSVFGPTETIQPHVDRLVPVLVAACRRIARAHIA